MKARLCSRWRALCSGDAAGGGEAGDGGGDGPSRCFSWEPPLGRLGEAKDFS